MPLYPIAGQGIIIRIFHSLYPPLSVMKNATTQPSSQRSDLPSETIFPLPSAFKSPYRSEAAAV
jgi:hypothetical protein